MTRLLPAMLILGAFVTGCAHQPDRVRPRWGAPGVLVPTDYTTRVPETDAYVERVAGPRCADQGMKVATERLAGSVDEAFVERARAVGRSYRAGYVFALGLRQDGASRVYLDVTVIASDDGQVMARDSLVVKPGTVSTNRVFQVQQVLCLPPPHS